MKKELAVKLTAYSGLTAALLVTKASDAQIIYTDINDVKIDQNHEYYSLDLNNDGIYDFGLRHNKVEGIESVGGTNYCALPNDCAGNGFLTADGTAYEIDRLAFLQPIGPAQGGWYMFSYQHFLACDGPASSDGQWWGGVKNGYFGMRMELGGDYYFGWGRAAVAPDANELIIKDYAFESTPGAPIQAGYEGCGESFEPNNSKSQSAIIQTNQLIRAQIVSANDMDWYAFQISGPAKNVRIVLSSLLYNYNVKLFNQNGNLIDQSVNKGMTNDTIIYNGLAAGNYYVKVLGKNGSFSSMDCYSLIVETSINPFRESITPPWTEATIELAASPNPFSEQTNIQFSLSENSFVNASLYDLEGRKMMTITEGNFEAGDHQLLLQKENFSSGIYFLQLRSSHGISTLKLAVQ